MVCATTSILQEAEDERALHRQLGGRLPPQPAEGRHLPVPGTTKAPKGKLRLLYEANPLAYIVEQAGRMATDGAGWTTRILDLKPTELHQRSKVARCTIGSKHPVPVPIMVEEAMTR
jgi:hypothetical protein